MKKSTAIGIAAVSVAGAAVIALGAVSSWFTNWNAKTWFGRGGGTQTVQPEKPDIPDTPVIDTDDNKNGAIISDGVNSGISLLNAKLPVAAYSANGISENAYTAFRLTAMVSPSDATDTRVIYSAAWANADSEWATGKAVSDYVVLQQTDYDLTATVECTQAFGEQVIITCQSVDTASVYATCTVDYLVKILGNTFNGQWIASAGDITCSFGSGNTTSGVVIGDLYMGATMSFSSVAEKSIGSMSDTFQCTATITPTSDIMGLLPNATAGSVTWDLSKSYTTTLDSSFVDSLFGSGVYGTSAFYQACIGTMSSTALKIVISYVGEKSEYSYTYYMRIDYRSVKVHTNSVALNTDTIIF